MRSSCTTEQQASESDAEETKWGAEVRKIGREGGVGFVHTVCPRSQGHPVLTT